MKFEFPPTDKPASLNSKRKDWLALNQDNVSEWIDMSTHGLLFQREREIERNSQHYKNPVKRY